MILAMRDGTELTEPEAELVNRLTEAYPAGLGYTLDRDPPMRELAAELVAEGRVERTEFTEGDVTGVSYRLNPDHAEELRQVAAERAESADWN
jgi:hypothetical protein